MPNLPQRKTIRLNLRDYASPGAYFVTFCTHDRAPILSDITNGVSVDMPTVELTGIGAIAERQLILLPGRFPRVCIAKFCIMPNHVHILMTLSEQTDGPSVAEIIGAYKSITTRLARPFLRDRPLFQRSFYDHVIRGEEDYQNVWTYIEGNPSKWLEDRFYPGKQNGSERDNDT